MKRFAILAALALSLGACANPEQLQTRVERIKTKVDVATGEGAKVLSSQCTLLQTGISIGSLFVKSTKVRNALSKAQVALNSYCSGPTPVDVPTALAAVAAAYRAVLSSSPEVRAEWTRLHGRIEL